MPSTPGRRREAQGTRSGVTTASGRATDRTPARRRWLAAADAARWPSSLHQILKNGLEVVVRRGDLVHDADLACGGHGGESGVERIGARRLDDHRVRLEPQA